jgi:hypothetical protein
MVTYPDDLIVLFDGVAIGQIAVGQRYPRKFFGRFIPGPGFDETLFADAVRWANVNASASPDVPFDQAAWDHWIEAIGHITAHISLPGVPVGLEEFAVDEDYEVEVTFDCDSDSNAARA